MTPREAALKRYRESRGKVMYLEERVRAFERRTGIVVHRDYKVDKAFVDRLYAAQNCFYCEGITAEDKRSIDHKISLARGGAHTQDNLCMACIPCNSSKGALTEDEFRSNGRLTKLIANREFA